MGFFDKRQKGFAGLFVLMFLTVGLVAVTYVVNSGKFNMNPNKSADETCDGVCYRNTSCSNLNRKTATGYCTSEYYVCCGSYLTSPTPVPSTPTPAPTKSPTPKPKTPTPTPISSCETKNLVHMCDRSKSMAMSDCKQSTIDYWAKYNSKVVGLCCTVCDCYGDEDRCFCCWGTVVSNSSPTPTPTPTQPSVSVVKITSGTCNSKCVAIKGTCLNVGTNSDGNNGKVMSWGNWTSCVTRPGTCNSNIAQLSSGGTTCSGTLPEWTKCRCKMNPYAN